MPSTYSSALRLELIATGEQSGSWGSTTNTNLGTLVEQAVAGVVSISMADANTTLTASNGASDQARNAALIFTGTLTAQRNIIVPTSTKLYIIKNSTSGGFSLVVKTASGTGVTVGNGLSAIVLCDGTNVVDVTGNLGHLQAANNFSDVANIITARTNLGVYDFWGGTSTNATNAYSVTASPVPTSYFSGMMVRFVVNASNTGAATINVNGLGAKSITKSGTTPLASGDLSATAEVLLQYDGTQFQLVSGAGGGTVNATAQVFVAGTDFTPGTTTSLTLSSAPPSTATLEISFDGIKQFPGASYSWTLSGTTVTFSPAIPIGTSAVLAQWIGTALSIGTPADGTVTDAKLAVTPNTANGYVKLDGSAKLPALDGSQLTNLPAPGVAFKNLLIGGDFTTNPWQRGTTFNGIASGAYSADRFMVNYATIGSGVFNVTQAADAPTTAQAGVAATNSWKVTVGTAATGTGAGTHFEVLQAIEAFNWGALGFGAASAQSVTLSFWVKSSVNGTYSATLQNYASTRSYPVNFTISAANTWEKKTITITGDTAGSWVAATNAGAAWVGISLHAGSTFQGTNATWAAANTTGTSSNTNTLITTLSATFQLALVQLEAGSTATTFEALPEDVVLARCQRYYKKFGGASANETIAPGTANGTTVLYATLQFPGSTMRAAPTIGYSAAGDWSIFMTGSVYTLTALSFAYPTPLSCLVTATVASGLTANSGGLLQANSTTNARITVSAEL